MTLNPPDVEGKAYSLLGINPIYLSLHCPTQNIQLSAKIIRHLKRQQGTTYCQKTKPSIQSHPDMTLMLELPERKFKITVINMLMAPKYFYLFNIRWEMSS